MEKLRRSRGTSSPRSCAEKKGFLSKAVERCRRSLGKRRRPPAAPPGCFAVLVGPERERFVVRAERANHPLFRALLDEAEAEYGFPRPATGPLVLPCSAEEFRRVMSEVERDEDGEEEEDVARGAALAGSSAAPRSPAWEVLLERRCPWRLSEDEPRAPHVWALQFASNVTS